MATGGDDGDSVREEFLSEAQEIVEALSRDLLLLDHGQKEGQVDPDLVNEVFRGVHTLKGLAGMFGYAQLAALAHAMENLLDDLRLGRVDLSQETLDVLFEGVENFQRLLGEAKNPEEAADVDLIRYAESLDKISTAKKSTTNVLEDYELDAGVLAVLTEYEEHRLRTNVEQGIGLFRLKVRFSLATIDSALEDLKARAKPVAEIITYLPSMGGGDGDSIDLDVLLASRISLAELRDALALPDATIEAVQRREGRSLRSPPSAAPAPVVAAPRDQPAVPEQRPTPVPDAPQKELAGDVTLRSVANTVRVDIRKLDHLMNVVGELAIVRSAVSRATERIRGRPEHRQLAIELHRIHRSFERHLEELQDGILDVRMVPLGQVFEKLARVVRQVAREHAKEIRLVVTGADTEVDKLIVEELSDPLMHIIRNAIDHGIESAKSRELAGKPKAGTLALNAFQKGNHVLIEIEDDGAGMDDKRIVETAVKRGLVTVDMAPELGKDEIHALIFQPGFSTRDEITDLSGRGVGLDVVKTNISRLGGIVDVQSESGIGTKFTITLPITLAIISALVVEVTGRTFALPLAAVQEALLLDLRAIRTVENREVLTLRGATLPLVRLAELFGFRTREVERTGRKFVVVTALGHKKVGLVVDSLQGQQDIVIKALGPSLRDVRGIAGATDLGDQRVALVLDAPALLEEVLVGPERALTAGAN